jgi:hypothetical protein
LETRREPNPEGCVYNVVLEQGHGLLVDDIECATWGHGLSDPAIQDPFYGTDRVIHAVMALPGWEQGWVHIRGALRHASRGVVAFLASHTPAAIIREEIACGS